MRTLKANYTNFFMGTIATWKRCNTPKRKPDYQSSKKYRNWDGELEETGIISSQYWYGEDSRGKYVIRQSDHWGNVATCYWILTKGKSSITHARRKCGKLYLV